MSALSFSVLAGLNYSVAGAISSFILGRETNATGDLLFICFCLRRKKKIELCCSDFAQWRYGQKLQAKTLLLGKVCWEIACRFVSIFGTGAMTLLRELWNTHLNDLYNVY